MTDARYLAIDTETTGLDWWGPHEAFLATTSDRDRDYTFVLDREADRENLVAQVHRATDLIMFNAQFDIHMLVKTGLFTYDDLLSKGIHDASILSRMLIRQDHVKYIYRLKNIADVILGDGSSDEETDLKLAMYEEGITRRPDQKELPDGAYLDLYRLRPDVVVKYAEKDTRITWELYWALMDRLTNPDVQSGDDRDAVIAGLQRVWDLERKTQLIVTRMEATGIKLDGDRMAALTADAEQELAKCELSLSEYLGGIDDFNADSPKQVAQVLVGAGVPLTEMSDDGNLRTDKFILAGFEADYPVVGALLGYRLYSKFLSTYLHPWQGREVLNPGINTVGTWTGRMSSSRPNLQNIPTRSGPRVREALVPRDGYSLVVADYSSIELRVLAYYMNDPDFWDLVLDRDVFLWMGEEIYGHNDQDAWPVSRSNLKNGTYAMIYGGGGPRIADTIGGGMTPDEGRALVSDIKRTLGPAFARLNNRVKSKVRRTGSVNTILGRRQLIPPDKKSNRLKDYLGLSALIQGSAADVMKLGLQRVAAAAPEFGAHLLLPVHDECLTEVPTEDADEWGKALSAGMEGALDDLGLEYPLPLKAEAVICHNHYAEAK